MKIFAIGDLHLSFGDMVEKPMDIFGGQWVGHTEKLYKEWNRLICPEDTVIICGDISWGLKLEEAMADLDWIHALPGRKLLFKGNHDLWWKAIGRLNTIYEDGNMKFVQNSCTIIEAAGQNGREAVCGPSARIGPGPAAGTDHDTKQ